MIAVLGAVPRCRHTNASRSTGSAPAPHRHFRPPARGSLPPAPPLPPRKGRVSAAGGGGAARLRRCGASAGARSSQGAGVDVGAYLRAPPVTAAGRDAPVLMDGPGGAEGAEGLRGRRVSVRPRGEPGSAADGAAPHLRGSAGRGPGRGLYGSARRDGRRQRHGAGAGAGAAGGGVQGGRGGVG